MFERVDQPDFVAGEHQVLQFWAQQDVFRKLQRKNAAGPRWSFLDGPITANNPMGVHHAWGRTYKDVYQRYRAMTGHAQRYQNGFDCQGLWVEVEVEKELQLGTKTAILEHGIDRFVRQCKQRVLQFAARQTEQSIRLGYWMQWDDPDELRKLADHMGRDETVTLKTPTGRTASGTAEELTARLGCPEWGGSYFTFSTENNETIWTFLKKCFERKKIYQGHDVMPWSGRAGSAYSQMEVADGRKLTTHRSCFVRFPIVDKASGGRQPPDSGASFNSAPNQGADAPRSPGEYLLVWTTTPWTLTSNVACAVNPDLEYVKLRAKKDGAVYYFAKENLEYQRLAREFKEGFGRPEWTWPEGVPKLKTIAQLFKEQGGYEVEGTLKGEDMVGWQYAGPFDDLPAQQQRGGYPQARKAVDNEDSLRETLADVNNRHDAYLSKVKSANFDQGSAQDGLPELFRDCLKGVVQLAADSGWIYRATVQLLPPMEATSGVGDRLFDHIRNLPLSSDLKQAWDHVLQSHLLMNEARFREQAASMGKHLSENTERDIEKAKEALSSWGNPDSEEFLTKASEKQREVLSALAEEFRAFPARTSVECHAVINGGRDSMGSPIVTSGEGSGLVHIAPGCGDVDHALGEWRSLVVVDPLMEDGTFREGFGPFSGCEAVKPETATLVFDQLKEKGLLVYVETYPHIYPHCWRTGDELVFRLVDEWFINMDWREEIKEVTRCIEWLPASIDGQERELEWLTNMRDWMISKKRFWGLALPIWVNPDDPSDFEVIGDLEELKERAIEGWDEFEGHTPHRPWIDKVKIKSQKTGAVLSRVEDVGNPWLDAGIVPFSTMHYNHDREEWAKWYPADFVTECFPGQFRNWFYSLLSLSTMMRYDETDVPDEKRPFKTLLGHRLVMDEDGNPMHKSDGTAIWFEEAAEQLGVDTLRWMYCAQNPDSDLRFGTRHPGEPVTLETPEGQISETKEGLPTCRVTSRPADEIRRQILIPLWNSYAFFVNYARLDEFDPAREQVPIADRPEIDRWILSNLQAFLQTANSGFQAYDVAAVCAGAAAFIDDLSNWYIRRNRRRFWRSKDASDTDKLAAYQTMYRVLLDLTKALAPIVPFMTERMYGNLVGGSLVSGGVVSGDQPESVHLCDYPQPDGSLFNPKLNRRTATAQRVVRLGHRIREEANLRVRQPLAELRYACNNQTAEDVSALEPVIADELNVKAFARVENLDDLVSYSYKPNLKTLGPKFGKLLGVIRKSLPELGDAVLAPLRNGTAVNVTFDGTEVTLEPDDVLISTEQASEWTCGDDAGIQIALSTHLTPELIREGMARDFVRHVQQARKDADLEITDRIRVFYVTEIDDVVAAVNDWREYIAAETLADGIERVETPDQNAKEVSVGGGKVWVWIVV
jgi:isoleucyl-tRNA synthetase